MRLLPQVHVLALRHRWLDPWQYNRRHTGGVRPYSPRRDGPLSHSRRCRRGSAGNAQRYPADGFECGVLNGKVQPGNTVAIVGAGPVGLAALLTAQFYSPAEIIMIDLDDNRLDVAKRFGCTATVNNTDGKAAETVMKMTNIRGVDTVIEAVGPPDRLDGSARESRRQLSADQRQPRLRPIVDDRSSL